MKGICTVLGTGTSQGVPVIACDCHVCSSEDPRDNRTRTAVMLSINNENHVIDAGPDFRHQMLREKVKTLKSVIFTHEHKDHVAGLDDVRAFNFKEKRHVNVYANAQVEIALRKEYHYIFAEKTYPGSPKINLESIEHDTFEIDSGVRLTPIEVMHYKLPVLGYRIGDLTYITDAKTITQAEKEKIKGSKTLIVNALRKEPHMSHFNLEEALEFIREISPEKAYLTHISHLFDTHKNIESQLPEGVFVAYDGLQIPFEY